jgi:flagellar biosynthesis/type III secretory pathway protein FliH
MSLAAAETDHEAISSQQALETNASAEALNLEEVRAQAFAEGLAQGLEQGQALAQQAQEADAQAQLAAQTAEQLQELLHAIDAKINALIEEPAQLQEPLKRLALHLAEQLVLSELTLSPQAVEHVMARCIETLDAADAATLVVELNPQDLVLLQSQPREEGQPQPSWRLQADALLLPGSVRVRADDAVVSDLIENRLESLAHSLLQDPQAWQANSAFAPTKLASRLASQRGSARTVEDAQAKLPAVRSPNVPAASETAPSNEGLSSSALVSEAPDFEEAEASDLEDTAEKHTYEAHEVMASASPAPAALTQNFAEKLNDISLELDKSDD